MRPKLDIGTRVDPSMTAVRGAGASIVALVLVSACTEPSIPDTPRVQDESSDDASVVLPRAGASQTKMAANVDADRLMDVEQCRPCHEDVVRHWSESAHAFASFDNPWYRATIDAFREERGAEASRFCAGCHDPVLMASGAIDSEGQPEDPRAHAGITCLVCHSVSATTGDGNGSFELDLAPVLIPDPNDESEVREHVARLTPAPLRTPGLCGSCHRSFLGEAMGNPHHLPGIDDIGGWRQSAFSGSHAERLDEPVDSETCQSCHMPAADAPLGDFAADEEGHIRSHRVSGAHTALAAQLNAEALRASRDALAGAVTVDVAAVRAAGRTYLPAETAPELEGEIEVDVVVRNTDTAHRFPGGTRDLQDTWLELVIRDRHGVLLEAGTEHDERPDPSALRFRVVLLDDEGLPDEQHLVHRFRARAFDKTIAPRDAAVVRYRGALPRQPSGPLTIEARVRHRRHPKAMQDLACEATMSPRGQAFRAAARALGRVALDGCAPQPVTDVAGARIVQGVASERALWSRMHDYALGLQNDIQERLDDGRAPIELGLAHAPDAHRRAMMLSLLGGLAGRQGRLSEALDVISRAESLVGAHPALHRLRGQAYAQVWQWPEAAAAFELAAEAAPNDALAWRDLARSLGSAGRHQPALVASQRGFPFAPRHPDLLLTQALASERLELAGLDAARQAFLSHREPDDQPHLLRRCQADVEGCHRDRQPVSTVELRRGPIRRAP